MHQLVFLIILIASYVVFIKNKPMDRTSKVILNCVVGIWAIALFLSIIRIANLNEVSDITYLLTYLGVITFVIGFCIIKINKERENAFDGKALLEVIEKITKNKFFIIFTGILCFYVYTLLVIFFEALMTYQTLGNVRTDFFSGDLYGSVFSQINAFVLIPFSIFSTPIFAYMLLYKRNFMCVMLGLFLLGYESLGAGRFGYIRIILAIFFILYILTNSSRHNKKNFNRLFIVIGLSAVLLLTLTTKMRTTSIGDDNYINKQSAIEETLEHIAIYTAAPITAFDYSISHNYNARIGGYQMGSLTMSGVTLMTNLFTSRIGYNLSTKSLENLVEIKQEEQIAVSKEWQNYNALYTANLFFYNDFGVLGIIIFPFIFGMLLRILIKQMYKTKSYFMVAVVSWGFYVAFFSIVDFWLVSSYTILSLIVFIILSKTRFSLSINKTK